MKVSEIFTSIEGEGARAGFPCIFLRFFGCNLRCSYCDSLYACEGQDYTNMSSEEILSKVQFEACKYGAKMVTITGGEPLLHVENPEFVDLLRELTQYMNLQVNIETNGSIDVSKVPFRDTGKIMLTVDWKSLSSGCSENMVPSNIDHLSNSDVLKFVVGSVEDLDQMKATLTSFDQLDNPTFQVFVSPIFGSIEPKEIVEYLLDNGLANIRIQLQLHKFIWDPNKRGV